MAEIGCPACARHLAWVRQYPGGRLSVDYHVPGVTGSSTEDRPEDTWEVGDLGSWGGIECACQEARRCGARFVLERQRIRELAELAGVKGHGIRWQPLGTDVERSDRLRPTFDGSYWQQGARTEPAGSLALLTKLSPPPPLSNWRPLKHHPTR